MGASIFVGSDGSYRGWLAALLCCCAAVNDDEDPIARRMDQPKAVRTGVCNQQPMPLKTIISRPMTAIVSVHNEAGFDYRERHISERPPSLKPLDFGEPSLLGRVYSPSRHTSSNSVTKRMTIGNPTGFRRLEYTEQQRRSLIPLQLEPVTLRDSVVVEEGYNMEQDSRMSETDNLVGNSIGCVSSEIQLHQTQRSQSKERQWRRPVLSSRSSSSSMRSMRRQAMETRSSSSSTPQSIDWSRLNRKRHSNRKSLSESTESDVEQEILELNTIVEEIRSESSRSRSSEGHVSAVAPLMLMKARSETLSDIGSAFSRRPKECQTEDGSASEAASDFDPQRVSPMENRLSRPFTAMPDLSAISPDPKPAKSRSDSRVGTWLSNVLGSSSTPVRRTREDFYSCRPQHGRAVSEVSTAVSALDSPIESQWTAGHSRAMTAESVMTPASTAPSTGRGFPATPHMAHSSTRWLQGPESPSKVGLAI